MGSSIIDSRLTKRFKFLYREPNSRLANWVVNGHQKTATIEKNIASNIEAATTSVKSHLQQITSF
jgi:hypothetical protein